MGLSTALNSAISGLQVTQAGVEIVSRNVANADTPGYTRKLSQQVAVVVNGEAIGARSAETTRVLDSLLQLQLRASTSAKARTDVLASVLSRLDALFGIPGGAGALDTAVNDFAASLQGLVDSPESQTARAGVVAQAEALAVRLNALSDGIQDMRADAERSLAEAAASANQILGRLAEINGLIVASTGSDVDLLDQRDQLLKDLSVLLDIQVQEADTGSLRVFTAAGNLLLDGRTAKTLVFDPKSQLSAQNLYDTDPAKRQVGTLLLDNGAGQLLDLFASGDIRSGLIGGYRELRDDLLVDAQAQLDELAHALASALSERQISGGAVSLGAQDGFDVDLAALLPGDEVSITYTQTPPGQTHTVTVVRVEDASLLPLDNALTADPGDTVIGIDFSAGIGAAAAALGAALGGSFSVSNPSGDTLRVLDDGAAGTIDISQLTARVTATGTADQGLGLALFTDGPGGAAYTNALDGGAQKIGFAGRIAVSPAVRADSSTLVVYSTSPPTPPGDQSRPLELLTRLTETPVGFIPTGGLGSASSPLVTSIDGYARELIVLQTGRAAAAEAESNAQTAVTATIEQRFSDESGVDVDQELARLIVLQGAYSANARVISVIQELLNLLVRV